MFSQTCLIILFLTCFSTITNTSPMELSYKHHCNSIVSESLPTKQQLNPQNLLGFSTGYYRGGKAIQGPVHHHYFPYHGTRLVSFTTKTLYRTEQPGLLKLEGVLKFQGEIFNYSPSHGNQSELPSLRLERIGLHGFWNESSGKLCMVGSGFGCFDGGKFLELSTVLNLNYPKVSTIGTSLVTGSLKSLENEEKESYFDPISILSIFRKPYNYSMLSKTKTMCSVFNTNPDYGFLKIDNTICEKIDMHNHPQFQLEFEGDCKVKNCNPFGNLAVLPRIMFIHEIHCSARGKVHGVFGFSSDSDHGYNHELVPESTFFGEGMWDEERNELCMVGCHLLSLGDSLEDTTVGDCNIGLSLGFPGILSLRNRNGVVGQIWSTKNANDSGYFRRFMFRNPLGQIQLDTRGLRYDYTEIGSASKSCGSGLIGWKKVVKKMISWGRRRYPNGVFSTGMSFYMEMENSRGGKTWIKSTPLTIGENFYAGVGSVSFGKNHVKPVIHEKESDQDLFNVSYTISINPSFNFEWGGLPRENPRLEISAEGIYDADQGILCMVGCRYVRSNNKSFDRTVTDSMDCEILINVQFPPWNPNMFQSEEISGTVRSTRAQSDPFYFEPLKISSNPYTDSVWGIEMDFNMVLICLTIATVVMGLQLYYVKNNPGGFPSVSLPMLVLLIMLHMIPLLLYFEAFFLNGTGFGYVVFLRIVTMVAFFLQFCLLQLIWPARSGERMKGLWPLYLCIPLYFVEALIACYVH